jgi:hypothetical protein
MTIKERLKLKEVRKAVVVEEPQYAGAESASGPILAIRPNAAVHFRFGYGMEPLFKCSRTNEIAQGISERKVLGRAVRVSADGTYNSGRAEFHVPPQRSRKRISIAVSKAPHCFHAR